MTPGIRAALVLACLASGAANAAPVPKGPSINGSVSVTGVVTSKCIVSVDGSSSSTFTGLIALGSLDGSGGHINPSLTGTSSAGGQSFTVVCSSATPSISLSATAMGDGNPAPSGYTSTVDYTARLDLATTSGTQTYDYATHGNPAATTGTMSHPFAGTSNNVTVSVNSLNTDGGANTSILTSGNYGASLGGTGGLISVTISP